MDPWSRPRQSLARGQAGRLAVYALTSVESGIPARTRLIERLDVDLPAYHKPEGMLKEARLDKEIASFQDAAQSRRALAMTLPGYGNTACLLRQTYFYQATYFQEIPQDRDHRTQEETREK
jgi:hypothetical protein